MLKSHSAIVLKASSCSAQKFSLFLWIKEIKLTMKAHQFLSVCLLFIVCNYAKAQELLTVEDAIKIGLEKNYSVIIVKNVQEIAKTQNNYGNAGMSPQVSLNGNLNLASVNSFYLLLNMNILLV